MKCIYKACLLAASTISLLVMPISAQDGQLKLKGFYVMTEEGTSPAAPLASIAALTFTESGGITGTKGVRTPTSLAQSVVQGSYSIDSTRTGTITLTASIPEEEGETRLDVVQYRVVLSPANEITAIRSNPGFYTVARFQPGLESGWSGNYSFAERSLTRPYARLGAIRLDSSGNVSGTQMEDSLGIQSTAAVAGTYSLSGNGFGNLTLHVPSAGPDGDSAIATENYLCLATKEELKMLRTNGDSLSILTLSR
jgi:hypothetical protein